MRTRFTALVGLAATLAFASSALSAQTANTLTPAEKAAGWKLLFDGKTTQGWHTFKKDTFPAKGWVVEDAWLHCLGQRGGDIVSESLFDHFELTWDWKIAEGGNSGLKYFVTDDRGSALGHEYQMLDDAKHPDGKVAGGKHLTASFYDVLKPVISPPTKPIGEVNHSRILVKGNHVEHWLNGAKTVEYECGSEDVKAAVAQSKFKTTEGFGNCLKGHILLQDHQSEVWFSNIKIREL